MLTSAERQHAPDNQFVRSGSISGR